MRILILSLTCLLVAADLSAQSGRIDLILLTERLTASKQTDYARCRAIFDWITASVAYDCGAENRAVDVPDTIVPPLYFTSQRLENILRTRRTRCEGYALLFRTMCRLAGIYATEVTGYARFDGRKVDAATVLPNHAWNAVLLDGVWHEIDLTAASGSCNGRRFEQRLDRQYWCMQPSLLDELYIYIDDWRTQMDEGWIRR